MCANQQVKRVQRPRFVGIDLRKQIEGVSGESGFSLSARFNASVGFSVFAVAQISLPEVIENLEGAGLQGIGFFQLQLGGLYCFSEASMRPEREMQLTSSLFCAESSVAKRSASAAGFGLEVGLNQIEFASRHVGGRTRSKCGIASAGAPCSSTGCPDCNSRRDLQDRAARRCEIPSPPGRSFRLRR